MRLEEETENINQEGAAMEGEEGEEREEGRGRTLGPPAASKVKDKESEAVEGEGLE